MTMETPSVYEGDYKGLKVGLCQIFTEVWAVEDNLKQALSAIEQAAEKGADIAVTPECVLDGYAGLDIFDNDMSKELWQKLIEISEPLDGKNITSICDKAKELGIYVLVGFVERGSEGEIYNSAALISRQGEIIEVYHKVHCRDFEDTKRGGLFAAGGEYSSYDIKTNEAAFKAGTMICFDREIPETLRCLRALGAEIVLCPLATNTADMMAKDGIEKVGNEIITRCRAAENELFIVVVNHAGRFNGGSFVVGPSGELLCQMGPDACVEVVDVPVEVVRKKFHSNPLGWMGWGYRRQDIYDKYLK